MEDAMPRYIWKGPGNLTISAKLIAPGDELVLDAQFVADLDPTVRFNPDGTQKLELVAEKKPEPRPVKAKGKE
jgi:hypothetical protein